MPAFNPVVLMDAKATPVEHTFDLVSTGNARAKMVNRAAAIPLAQENLNVSVSQPNSPKGAYAVNITAGFPKTVTETTGITTVHHVNSASVSLNWSQQSTRAERADDLALVIGALQDLMIQEAILDIEPVYG
jgi:hypothetical protein